MLHPIFFMRASKIVWIIQRTSYRPLLCRVHIIIFARHFPEALRQICTAVGLEGDALGAEEGGLFRPCRGGAPGGVHDAVTGEAERFRHVAQCPPHHSAVVRPACQPSDGTVRKYASRRYLADDVVNVAVECGVWLSHSRGHEGGNGSPDWERGAKVVITRGKWGGGGCKFWDYCFFLRIAFRKQGHKFGMWKDLVLYLRRKPAARAWRVGASMPEENRECKKQRETRWRNQT